MFGVATPVLSSFTTYAFPAVESYTSPMKRRRRFPVTTPTPHNHLYQELDTLIATSHDLSTRQLEHALKSLRYRCDEALAMADLDNRMVRLAN